MNKSILILLILIFVLPNSIYAKRKPTLGILPFEIKEQKVSGISKHMYSYLRKRVSEIVGKQYNIKPSPNMDLEEMYMMFACDSPNVRCMISIAKMMKSRYLIYGTVSTQRGKYELVLRLLDSKHPKDIKKGRLIGNLISQEAMNKNIDNALIAMFNIKEKKPKVTESRLLSINTKNITSNIYIDGKKIGTTPILLTSKDIKPGKHIILIKKEKFEPVKKVVFLTIDKIEKINLALSPIVNPALKKGNKTIVKKEVVINKKDETLDLSQKTNTSNKPKEWYKEWWVWGTAGGVITATVIVIVLLSGNNSSSTNTNNNVVISF